MELNIRWWNMPRLRTFFVVVMRWSGSVSGTGMRNGELECTSRWKRKKKKVDWRAVGRDSFARQLLWSWADGEGWMSGYGEGWRKGEEQTKSRQTG